MDEFSEIDQVGCLDVVLGGFGGLRYNSRRRDTPEDQSGSECSGESGSGPDDVVASASEPTDCEGSLHLLAFEQESVTPNQLCVDPALDEDSRWRIDAKLRMMRLEQVLPGYGEFQAPYGIPANSRIRRSVGANGLGGK